MPLPLIGAIPSLGTLFAGGIIAGLTQFFISKAGMILAGMGLTFITVKGLQSFLGYVISDVQTLMGLLNSANSSSLAGGGFGAKLIQFAGYAGLFDGINIMISGYMAYASLLGLRFVLGRR